jgi:hypothetical protein
MAVGTSMGAFYEDSFHAAAAQWDPKYDDNKSDMQKAIDSQTKQTNDPMIIQPVEITKGDLPRDEISPDFMMRNNQTGKDMDKIENDDLGGKPIGMKSQMPFPDNHNPDTDFDSRFPHNRIAPQIEDRRNESLSDVLQGWVGSQFTMDKLNAILQHPLMNPSQTMTANIPARETQLGDALGYRELSSDSLDYDMDAWKKANPNAEMKPGQHYPDTYKLPNHMTFSDDSIYSGQNGNEGGHWGKEDNKWTFTPGKTNLQYHTIGEMKDYFKKVEPDSKLIINK